jgi:tetratricopeptide (TPR) repeat protein
MGSGKFWWRIRSLNLALSMAGVMWAAPAFAEEQPKWIRVSSDHFTVLTDAPLKKGQEVAARFEQMRAVFGELLGRRKLRSSEPIDIIALASDKEYAKLAPLEGGQATSAAGFVLAGDDRLYFVLNLFYPDSWRAAEHQLGHYYLKYNYPPTQPWFDEGLAEYFASLNFTAKQAELGGDPELHPVSQSDLFGHQSQGTGMKSLTEILDAPVWLTLPDLFGMKNRVVNGQEGTHSTLFYAQSWMTVHYLVNKDKLAETGKYLQLVMSEKVPVEQAVQQAYGMSVAQLEQAIKDYFHSLKPLMAALEMSKQANAPPEAEEVYQSPLPFTVDEVAASWKQLPRAEATALVDEMELRIPERRQQAVEELEKLTEEEKSETTVAHRALSWYYMQKSDFARAYAESRAAVALQPNDPWVRYYLALTTYRAGEKAARVQGLANMMESLQIVVDEYPDFAEAYNMLGWARLTGGGSNSAIEALKMAIQLSPRDEEYQLRLTRAYLAAKKYEEATALLNRLAQSSNPAVERAAKKDLQDLPFLKKYGVPPEEPEKAADKQGGAELAKSAAKKEADGDEEDERPARTKQASAPQIDRRPVHFLKGKLVAVDCSGNGALITFSGENRTVKLRAADRDSALVIGAPKLSCEWKNIAANVNYRASSKQEGDLVSIEIP